MPLIPLLFMLAGLALYISRRRNAPLHLESSRVVKGHTYSDSVTELEPIKKPRRVQDIRNACFVGSGYVGALTAIVLAKRNPNVQFFVVDPDPQRIAAWNSDQLPIFEPGLEDVLFYSSLKVDESLLDADPLPTARPRLLNVTFSTDVPACIARADIICLCVDTSSSEISIDDDVQGLNLVDLEAIVQTIAHVSTGHKIVVQKSTAPCDIVPRIAKLLKYSAATFDVLSNPEFITPGTAIRDLTSPHRVVIGHIVSEGMASAEAVDALKRLYTPWVPEDRIITTDACSSELAKIAVNALIAQRISSLQAVKALSEASNVNMDDITQILGTNPAMELESLKSCFGSSLQANVSCLVYLARELGLKDVADYWRAVNRVNETPRIVQPQPVPCIEDGPIEEDFIKVNQQVQAVC